jgi:F-type H+-transporting ATPase subunit delta
MKIARQAQRDGKTLFRSCLVNGLLDESRVRTALAQVVAQKPRGYVGILQYFHRLVRLEVERRSARVESARALSPELQAAVQANLAQSYGSGLTVQFAPNPALVGGLRIKVGSDVFDGSVDARLTALAESF